MLYTKNKKNIKYLKQQNWKMFYSIFLEFFSISFLLGLGFSLNLFSKGWIFILITCIWIIAGYIYNIINNFITLSLMKKLNIDKYKTMKQFKKILFWYSLIPYIIIFKMFYLYKIVNEFIKNAENVELISEQENQQNI